MSETGKLAQVIAEMRRHKLHILGMSESRWTGSVRQTTTTGETVLYSGREDNQHHERVVVILRKGMEKSLLEWKPVSSLMRARLRGWHINITLIQYYAPIIDREDADKDAFYQQLQAQVNAVLCHDLTIVMGDLTAKVGSVTTYCDRAMGKHGCGTRNENGERLADVCNINNPVIGGTPFPTSRHPQADMVLTQWQRQESV